MHNIHFKRPEEILLNDLILFIFGDGNTFYFRFQFSASLNFFNSIY